MELCFREITNWKKNSNDILRISHIDLNSCNYIINIILERKEKGNMLVIKSTYIGQWLSTIKASYAIDNSALSFISNVLFTFSMIQYSYDSNHECKLMMKKYTISVSHILKLCNLSWI